MRLPTYLGFLLLVASLGVVAPAAAQTRTTVPEHDTQGRPLFYYGKVQVSSPAQMGILDLFRFTHSPHPFFDEYDPAAPPPSGMRGQTSRSEYAIATGVQWNVLLQYPGLVDQVSFNPRATKAPHPMLDAILRADGSLNPQTLADNGFRLPAPPLGRAPICTPGTLIAFGLLGDIGDALSDLAEGVADLAVTIIKKLGGTIASVLELAYQGVTEALDLLRELGNAGVCAIAGSRSNEGTVYVYDPMRDSDFLMTFGPNVGHSEPIRRAKMSARGGPGGILLTVTHSDETGHYRFDDLCGDITYGISLELEAPQAWISNDGFGPDRVFLGDIGPDRTISDWHTHNSRARWLLGTQVASQFDRDFFHFTPGQAKIIDGWFTDSIISSFSNDVSMTACGQIALLAPLVPFAGPLLDGDIYARSDDESALNSFGVAVHEYGHFTMCRAIDQFGGNLDSFLNAYLGRLIIHPNGLDSLYDSVRSTSESFADYVSFNAVGYTSYFRNDTRSGLSNELAHWCAWDGSGATLCLEPDGPFRMPPGTDRTNEKGHAIVASRTSILFDWTDTGSGPWGFSRRTPIFGPDDDALTLPTTTLARAVAHVGSQIKTENLSQWIAGRSEYGNSAESLCTVYRSHDWDCAGIGSNVALDAPTDLVGIAVSTTDIVWSWIPRSELAATQALLDGSGHLLRNLGSDDFTTQMHYAASPNQPIVAQVQALRPGSSAAASARVQRCTLTSPVNASVSVAGAALQVTWPSDPATEYQVLRANGSNGSFAQVGVVAANGGNGFTDDSVVPGVSYRYRVDGRNCDGVSTQGSVVTGSLGLSDSAMIFVRANAPFGGDGTRLHPVNRISAALSLVSASRHRILVAPGPYSERVAITNAANIVLVIAGGYNADFTVYDPTQFRATLFADSSTADVAIGSGEFASITHPVVSVSGAGSVTLQGIDALPLWPTCATRAGCRPGSFLALQGPILTLRDVRYRATNRGNADPNLTVATLNADYGSTIDILDSSLVDANAVGNIGILAPSSRVTLTGSLVVAGQSGDCTGVFTEEATVTRSVVRALGGSWTGAGSTGLYVGGRAIVSDSLIAGELALVKNAVVDSVRPHLAVSYVVNSILFGETQVAYAQLTNDIFLNDHGVMVHRTDPGVSRTGVDVRHNIFVPMGAGVSVATTAQRDRLNLGPISASNGLNSAMDWFRDGANRVEGNRVLALGLVTGSSTANPDVNSGTPPGHVLRPQPAAVGGLGASISEYGFGAIDLDLDGVSRPSGRDIGPYSSTP
jgi:hypothetical protein